MAITIPNLKIKTVLDQFIGVIRLNYAEKKAANLEQESWLYRVFGGVKYGNFDYYTQAIEILINRDTNNPRMLNIRNGFSLVDKPQTPTIFINVPSEKMEGINAIGFGFDSNDFYENSDSSRTGKYFASFGGNYELMITSMNADETELLYRFLEALFISANDTLALTFDGKFDFSGKQIMINPDLNPNGLFMKVWTISIQHKTIVPQLVVTEQMLSKVEFFGNLIYGETAIGENQL
jgi:hypothetical protein